MMRYGRKIWIKFESTMCDNHLIEDHDPMIYQKSYNILNTFMHQIIILSYISDVNLSI